MRRPGTSRWADAALAAYDAALGDADGLKGPYLARTHAGRGAALSQLKQPDAAPPAYRTRVVDLMDEVGDFADTAALIDGLDLAISVDTSVAHLAAAMGKPVWLLNCYAGCWRWLRDRDDSPWYPGLRLFTQRERLNWHKVLERARGELERHGVPASRRKDPLQSA